jgi:hypothetical protein
VFAACLVFGGVVLMLDSDPSEERIEDALGIARLFIRAGRDDIKEIAEKEGA